MKKLLLLAGEESGMIYARRLKALMADVEVRGYADYGFRTADLAVFGIWPVIRKLFFFLRVKRTLERAIDEWRPDVVCTIDYPGMNLKLAAYAKRRGIRAVHVVCPQVWAWHQGRIPKIEANLDRLCCFLPFEPAIFRPGFATFVGHPLFEEFGGRRDAFVPVAGERTLALLPGSRLGEIHYHLPILMAALVKLGERAKREGVKLRVVVPAANDKTYAAIAAQGIESLASEAVSVEIRRGQARETLFKADAAVVASGTATMEAALAGVPSVIVYKVSWLLGEFLKRAITGTKYVGLANVIWDRCRGADSPVRAAPMPELLQDDFTSDRVSGLLADYLFSERANAAARADLAETVKLLSVDGESMERIRDVLFQV